MLSPLVSARAGAQGTFTAATCNQSDVNAVINGPTHKAVAGDKIIVQVGSCSWTGDINVPVPIDIECAIVAACIITNANTHVETSAGCNGTGELFCLNIGSGFHMMIGGFSFLPSVQGCSGSGYCLADYVIVQGSGLAALMHDMSFNLPNEVVTHAVQWLAPGGVIWNTTFASTSNLTGGCGTQIGSQSGSIVVKSTIPWDAPSTMGTLDTTGTNNLYMEDDVFSYVGQVPDVDDNGRVVLRYNTISNVAGGLTHGTTSSTGGRFVEMYNNIMTDTNPNLNVNRYFWWRAGTAVVTQNTIQALTGGGCYGVKPTFTFTVENARASAAHGCVTGYMGFHQPGSGASATAQNPSNVGPGNPAQTPGDSYQISDPIYIWGNTGTGATYSLYGDNEGSTGSPCNNVNPATGVDYQTSDFFVHGRDLITCEILDGCSSGGAKPGWAPYTYPHPLRALLTGTGIPTAPSSLTATVQ
jgi:hypothetical protein